MMNYKKIMALMMCTTLTIGSLYGCKSEAVTELGSDSSVETNISTASISELTALKLEFDDEDLLSEWSADKSTVISLNDTSADINGSGAAFSDNVVTISESGTYVISGELHNGCIKVNSASKETVRLIFNGITISNDTTSPIIIEEAEKVIITLAENTSNTVSDASRTASDEDKYSAAILSKSDLVINGTGSLTINGNYRNGIKSSDDLRIVSGEFIIRSVEDGIIGKDFLGIKDGSFSIEAGIDGLKSNNDSNSQKGNIIIEDGGFNIVSGNDGVQAENKLIISGGSFEIKTGSGAEGAASSTSQYDKDFLKKDSAGTETASDNSESIKGLKAGAGILITDGDFLLDCEDDAVHSNGLINITGSNLTISSGDDGIHADDTLQIDNGKITITDSYEGLEALTIILNGGDISVTSSDDGLNASDGSGSNTVFGGQMPNNGGFGGGQGQMPDKGNFNGGEAPSMPGGNFNGGEAPSMPDGNFNGGEAPSMPDGNFNGGEAPSMPDGNFNGGEAPSMPDGNFNGGEASTEPSILINGGTLFVNAGGDGIDSNGSVSVTGGNIVVCGPTSDGDCALDYETAFTLTGGTLMAFGSSGMLESPSSAENGCCIVTTFSSQGANTQFSLSDANGNTIMSYVPVKSYASAVLYSADIKSGTAYTVTVGDVTQTITVNDAITQNNTSGGFGGGQRPGKDGFNGGGFGGGRPNNANDNGGGRNDKI